MTTTNKTERQPVDILIIGGGPGGTPAAMGLASMGKRVLLVEKGQGLGGTCLFEGCIPSKILWESARRLRELRNAQQFGLSLPPGDIGLDWATLMKRKHTILTQRAAAAQNKAQAIPTLQLEWGHASLLGPRRARITPTQGDAYEVEFEKAILATGSVPNLLPIPGIDLPQVVTSEGLLDLDHLPKQLVVIGGGPIGVEMAQIFHALGTQVTLLEVAPRILLPVDEEVALTLQDMLKADGITLHLNVRVSAIRPARDAVVVDFTTAHGESMSVPTETVLDVTGRHPRVDGLGLGNTAVAYDHHGIHVNEQLETHEPGIYAVGDVIGQPMFAHWATAQALALVHHLAGRTTEFPTPARNTAVIFSTPEVGIAGLTEAEARTQGFAVSTAHYEYAVDARAQVAGSPQGLLKFVYATDTHRVLGVHVLAEGAGDLMGEAALVVRAGVSLEAIASSIHPHPTLTESFGVLARTILAEQSRANR